MSDEENPEPESLLKKELDEFMSKLESKKVENRKEIMVTIVDGPKDKSIDGAGTESQNDEISIQPGSSKPGPFKNRSMTTDPNQTENKSKQAEIRKRVLKSIVDGPQVEIQKRLNIELEAKLITLNKNKENFSPNSALIENSFKTGCKISVLLFYVFF